ncbi:biopolymer transporter ExbB [Cereibacter sphaeroides]|uniref:biopolymer transporter ExbB n=1 Tax=Cereibacter sphaeroides TaxID=1063 RepID=UPI001F2E382A|nr:biopolymer transporter ExbB [Cereibacter sphaeroides]MCE6961377.1 biopolymer transporter ExbB [Cereibacter sphaeroides]MCE6970363.1 biopolymer transporter ExbB [Cereibacter sphaeroides]MCE6973942.1 biopolymer transporter ExbB [Cereibacter sphaeroides]
MPRTAVEAAPHFTQPVRQILMMLVVLALVAVGGAVAFATLRSIFLSNPYLNAGIGFVFLLGVATCFMQMVQLVQSVTWIENFVEDRPGFEYVRAPRLLAPLAALLRSRGKRMQISSTSSRTILDSVGTRLDESRDITHYLASLLIFLGLLGTFYGLATTVPALVQTIRSLAPDEGQSGVELFGELMEGFEGQLGGMGTAFSSSLLGLAGSLVVGLLVLFTSHGQNRFYGQLEEWLSSFTRLTPAGVEGEGGETSMVAGVLEQMIQQMDRMQELHAQADVSRDLVNARMADLATAVARLADRIDAQSNGQAALLERVAGGQERLVAALGGAEASAFADAEARMRLRSIDVQLLRILEEIAAGRQESVSDLRSDLAALTAAVRQLSRSAVARS